MPNFLDPRLEGLDAYTPGEQPRETEVVKLNTNENPYPPSPKVVAAIDEAAVRAMQRYADPTTTELRTAIAAYYGLTPDHVICGNGSDELLALCFHGLCGRGAIFPDLTYGFYPVYGEMFGVETETVPLREDGRIEPEDYRGTSRTLFIANPNAPTGLALSLDQLRSLLDQDPERLVVVDEAYVDFGADSAVALIGEYENVLVLQTFSKSRQLAGLRLAMALGSPALIRDLGRLKFSFNPYSVNGLALRAGVAAIRDTDYFERTRRAVMATRETLTRELRALGFDVLPSLANFVFAKPPAPHRAEDLFRALKDAHIYVRYFPEGRGKDRLRITVGTDEQCRVLTKTLQNLLTNGT